MLPHARRLVFDGKEQPRLSGERGRIEVDPEFPAGFFRRG